MAELIDIDKEMNGKYPSPVKLHQEFLFQRNRCKVVRRYKHAFDYEIPEVPKGPMENRKQITYAFWKQQLGRKIKLIEDKTN